MILYESSMEDHSLKQELLAWRKQKAHEIFGNINYFTPNVFLHSSILYHILDLAHAHKIKNLGDPPVNNELRIVASALLIRVT